MAGRSSIPPVTKILLTFLVVCSLVSFILRYATYLHIVTSETHDQDHAHLINPDSNEASMRDSNQSELPDPHELYVPFLALVPGQTHILTAPWILFTTTFIEDGLVPFTISFFLILYTGRYIEVLWGSREFFTYLLCNIIISNAITLAVYKTKLSFDESIPISPITGSAALIVALLVAIKQRIPNHYLLFLDGFIRLRVSLVPFFIICINTILTLVSANPYFKVINLLSWLGLIVSWVYLRFLKEGGSGRQLSLLPITESGNSMTMVKGDRTKQFALCTFFPDPFSYVVAFFSDRIFDIFVNVKLLDRDDFQQALEEDQDEASSSNLTQNDLISQMSQSRIFTSSSLAGASGGVSTLSLPKAGLLKTITNKVQGLVGGSSAKEDNRSLASRRQQALAQLDSKLSAV